MNRRRVDLYKYQSISSVFLQFKSELNTTRIIAWSPYTFIESPCTRPTGLTSAMALLHFSPSLHAINILAPRDAKSFAVSYPIPVLAPVISTVFCASVISLDTIPLATVFAFAGTEQEMIININDNHSNSKFLLTFIHYPFIIPVSFMQRTPSVQSSELFYNNAAKTYIHSFTAVKLFSHDVWIYYSHNIHARFKSEKTKWTVNCSSLLPWSARCCNFANCWQR